MLHPEKSGSIKPKENNIVSLRVGVMTPGRTKIVLIAYDSSRNYELNIKREFRKKENNK
jgi:hypothetical protein